MKIKKFRLKAGDVGLVKNKGFLPKAIRFFMNIYRKKLGLEPRPLYNHVFTVVEVWGSLFAAEAMADGYNIRPINVYLNLDGTLKKGVKVKVPKRDYNKTEREYISKSAALFAFNPTRYDYFALLHQLKYSLTLAWKGKKGIKAQKRLYCSEAHATLANQVRPKTFKEPATVNPIDIDINKYYLDIENKSRRVVK